MYRIVYIRVPTNKFKTLTRAWVIMLYEKSILKRKKSKIFKKRIIRVIINITLCYYNLGLKKIKELRRFFPLYFADLEKNF